jgi:hypothetical protein
MSLPSPDNSTVTAGYGIEVDVYLGDTQSDLLPVQAEFENSATVQHSIRLPDDETVAVACTIHDISLIHAMQSHGVCIAVDSDHLKRRLQRQKQLFATTAKPPQHSRG